MKRCPTCNQTFTEEWLSFCTQDGTSLVDTSALPPESWPTVVSPPMPPSVSPSEQPTLNLPGGGYRPPAMQPQPSQPFSQPQPSQPFGQPQPSQPMWQPPPPPRYATSPQQGFAVASLICGIFSITLGWCCSMGVLSSPAAIVLGIVSLVQIKNDPTKHGGKPLAIVGIATAAVYLVIWVLIFVLYGVGVFMQGLQ